MKSAPGSNPGFPLCLTKQVFFKIMEQNKMGMNLRTLLDTSISIGLRTMDLSNYEERNKLINFIEERIMECDWISMSNGTTYEKTFTPKSK